MSGYTNGPWYVRVWAGDEWPEARVSIGPEEDSRSVAVLISPRYPSDNILDDANLAAAAPDLLEALEYMCHAMSDGDPQWLERGPLAEQARAAIAKAKGES